jgi:hypothetical protein
MGRTRTNRVHTVKKKCKEGICHIIENGKNCTRTSHCRGLCSKHYNYFLRWELVEKYGAPHKFAYVETNEYEIKKDIKEGICRINENSKDCPRSNHGRGLCAHHWLTFDRHDLLKKYGTSSQKDPRTFKIKKKIVKGICRIIENGKGCKTKLASHGLCSKHYQRFWRSDELSKFGIKK